MARLRDGRQFGFCIIDNRILDDYGEQLGAAGLAVYLCLVRHAGRDREAWPSYRELGRILHFSPAKVCREIKTLVSLGLMTATRKVGKVQVYRIVDPREEALPKPIACAPSETPCACGETPSFPVGAPAAKHDAPPVKHPCAPSETPCACGETMVEHAPLEGLNNHQHIATAADAAAAEALTEEQQALVQELRAIAPTLTLKHAEHQVAANPVAKIGAAVAADRQPELFA